jgi:hypothetical protein
MPRSAVEAVSANTVLGRVVGGIVVGVVGLFWPVRTQQDRQVQYVVIAVAVVLIIWGWRAVSNPRLAIRYAWAPRSVVVELIRSWKPDPARLEADYERSLHAFLKSKLPFVKVTRQYGTGRVKCDLATGNNVLIELKAGFRSTQKLQRLIGQIDLFRKELKKPVVVVLLGETEEDLLHDLNRSIKEWDGVTVVTKEVETPAEITEAQAN